MRFARVGALAVRKAKLSFRCFFRIWTSGKADAADDEANAAHSATISQLSQSISALLHLEDLAEQANRAFLPADDKGGVVITKDIDPNSAKLAQMAEAAARDKTEVRFLSLSHTLHPRFISTSDPYILLCRPGFWVF